MNYCSTMEDRCQNSCYGNSECLAKCHRQRICCERDCPCHPNCLDGCPCPGWIDDKFCPEIIVDKDCMKDWGQEARQCEYDCRDTAYECLDGCYGNSNCVHNCHDEELRCLDNCPCHKNCQNGCDYGYCPTWDKYCPYTTPVTTRSTTPKTTTKKTTTTSYNGGTPPTAPPIDELHGDSILILSDDKAMLHQWPRGEPTNSRDHFRHLQDNYNAPNSVWDMNGFWVHDACSVQFKGESYIIGGAYNCDKGTTNCEHLNIQRAIVKLSNKKCGLDIVWDGNSSGQKLPYDMKEHSCAVFQKRQGTTNNYQQHVMMCSPDDTANDNHNGKDYIDRWCWRYQTAFLIMYKFLFSVHQL